MSHTIFTPEKGKLFAVFFSLLLLILAIIGLVVLGDVERLVNRLRNRLDVRVHLLLDALHVVSIVVCDQVDGQTQVA